MATIAEIRQQYPQYSDMSDAALADALHTKFYSDMPKQEFYSKVGLSSGQYASAVPQLDAQGNLIRQDAIPGERRMSAGEQFMQIPSGIYRGVQDVTDVLAKGGASALDYLVGTDTRAAVNAAAAAQQAEYNKVYGDSILAGGGRFAGNVIATAPVGGLAAAPVRMMATAAPITARVATPVAEALASGGFRAGQATGAGGAAARTVGGAVTGGASAGLVNPEDVEMGAAIGAAVPFVGSAAGKAVSKTTGWLTDLITGRLPTVEAGKIARESLGKKLPEALTALQNARPGITATQALKEAGVDADPFMALGELAAKNDIDSWYRLLSEAQKAAQEERLVALAGGGTQTAARTAAKESAAGVTAATTPMREIELQAANTAGQVQNRLAPLVGQRTASAQNALQMQGQLATDAAQQETIARLGYLPTQYGGTGRLTPQGVSIAAGNPRIASRYTLNAERAPEYTAAAGDVGAIAAQRKAEAKFIQGQIDSLAEHGLTPINTDRIISSINTKLNDPRIGPSDVNTAVLSKVSNKIQDWTARNNGVIDADALYTIRKNAVGEEIARLYPNADAKAQEKYAAKLLSEIKPLIDDAIEDAGGTGWRQYLQAFETGMKGVEQQKMAGKALEMFQNSPKKFIKLATGNDTKAVEKVFGPGSFDIVQEMGRKSAVLEDVAQEVQRDISIKEQAKAGAAALPRILGMSESQIKKRIPAFFSKTTTTLNMMLDILENEVSAKTKNVLTEGFKSGKNAAQLLNELPTKERNAVLNLLLNSSRWNPSITRGAGISVNALNPDAPSRQNELAR